MMTNDDDDAEACCTYNLMRVSKWVTILWLLQLFDDLNLVSREYAPVVDAQIHIVVSVFDLLRSHHNNGLISADPTLLGRSSYKCHHQELTTFLRLKMSTHSDCLLYVHAIMTPYDGCQWVTWHLLAQHHPCIAIAQPHPCMGLCVCSATPSQIPKDHIRFIKTHYSGLE